MSDTGDTEYLLCNASHGGFSMNRDFLIELFKKYPTHTDVGKEIFTMEKNDNIFCL